MNVFDIGSRSSFRFAHPKKNETGRPVASGSKPYLRSGGPMPMESEMNFFRFCLTPTAMPDRPRRIRCFCAGLLILVPILLTGCAKKEVASPLPPEVEVTPVTQQDVPLYTECIATLDGYVNAQIQPQVTGYLGESYGPECSGAFVRSPVWIGMRYWFHNVPASAQSRPGNA